MRTMSEAMARWRDAFRADEDGATAIEYGLIAALLAVAIIGSMVALSSTISDTFSEVQVEYEDATD